MKKLLRGAEWFSASVAKLVLAVMASVVVISVVGRYLFNSPLAFTNELSGSLMIPLTFLGLAYVQRKRGHVWVELLFDRLPGNAQKPILVAVYLVAIVFIAYFAYTTFVEVILTIQLKPIRFLTITAPEYYIFLKISMLAGLVFLTVRLVAELCQLISAYVKGAECPSH